MTRLACLCLATMLLGCSTAANGNYQNIARDVRGAMQASTLGPGDVINVRVYLHEDLKGEYEVSPVGQINFPLIGLITIEGLTAAQVSSLVRGKLAKGFLRDPHVIVTVSHFNSKKVFVLGQVKKSGRFRYVDNMTVVEAITLAGGFGSMAEKNYVIITRGTRRIPVPVEKIMQGLAPNFGIRPGDLVYVPQRVL
ncbi:MAG: polysaccharide export protein [Myxococcales bacterium]|nr:polysaccharide export protein [Myxococcales bacterium]